MILKIAIFKVLYGALNKPLYSTVLESVTKQQKRFLTMTVSEQAAWTVLILY